MSGNKTNYNYSKGSVWITIPDNGKVVISIQAITECITRGKIKEQYEQYTPDE